MINAEIITQNECANDGTLIYLYHNKSIGVWTAFGLSAYWLRLFGKTYNQDNPRGYSEELQMPCTLADKRTIDKLLHMAHDHHRKVECKSDQLCFKMSDCIDMSAYNRWTNKLRNLEAEEAMSNDDQVTVLEGVGTLPKNTYIKDGMSSFERNVKRVMDCFLAFIAMIIFSPLFLICWIAIKHEDHGSAIFKQERIGRFGHPFYIYKFRSMRLDAEKNGPTLSHAGGDGDPRLTKVGRFLRAHHLDELPQLWNVFVGDMAFIGPRPERKFYIDQIMEYDKRYEYLYQIRPGVTSYATLYNGYTDTMEKMLRRLEYDLYYLGHRSWWLDFRVLYNTFLSIVLGKKF